MPGIIILAAGASTRMGGNPKQLIVYQGQTLLKRTLLAAMALAETPENPMPIVVVTGGNQEKITPELTGLPVAVVHNPDWQTGMASSVRVGLTTLLQDAPSLESVLMLLTDQPHVSPELLRRVLAVFNESGKGIVGCEYAGQVGVPALFARRYVDELLNLTGDRGAKPLMMKHADDCATIRFDEGAVDLDTPEDVAKFLAT
jgi:molybdenum cofactor cytidylyltransferase